MGAFRYIAIVFGLAFALLVPPFQSPDEPAHWKRAYALSEGQWMARQQDQRLGLELPRSLDAVIDSFQYLKNDYSARLSYDAWQQVRGIPLEASERHFSDLANTGFYAPFGYVPQALGIAIGRFLGASALDMLYWARIFNLLSWLLLLELAFAAPHFLLRPVQVFCLFPAVLVLSASANPDVAVFGVFVLLFMRWTRAADTLAALRGNIPELLLFTLICAQKIIVWPLVLLARRRYGTALAGLLAIAGWAWYSNGLFIPYDAYNPAYRDFQTLNPGVHPAAQANWVLAHPLDFLWNTGVSLLDALPSALAHLSVKFGWEKNYLPAWVMGMLFGALALATSTLKCGMRNAECGIFMRLRAATAIVLYVAGFAFTMYLLWHPVGAGAISNWQGRYFFMAVPLFLLLIGNDKLSPFFQGKNMFCLKMGLNGVLIFANIYMAVAIGMRYWL